MGSEFKKVFPRITLFLLVFVKEMSTAVVLSKSGRLYRHKRSITCPRDQSLTAQPGRTCAVATWSSYWSPTSGGNSGDCFTEGSHMITYSKTSTSVEINLSGYGYTTHTHHDSCTFRINVLVHYCQVSAPQIIDGNRRCTGDSDRVFGTTCSYSCPNGYRLQGPSTVSCVERNTNTLQYVWSTTFPTACQDTCSRWKNHCWPGDCYDQLAANCVCRPGFKPRALSSPRLCDLDTAPVMETCRISVTDSSNNVMASGYSGSMLDCSHQKDEIINTQPVRLTFHISAHTSVTLSHSVENRTSYVQSSQVGVTGIGASLFRIDLQGQERSLGSHRFTTCFTPEGSKAASADRPISRDIPYTCAADINVTVVLADGEKLCADMESFSGGYYVLQDENLRPLPDGGKVQFTPVSAKKRVCFLYDPTKPRHCSLDGGCSTSPLELATRISRVPEVRLRVDGWRDPIPTGGRPDSASGIQKYLLEVKAVLTDHSPLVVEDKACDPKENFTHEWAVNVPTSGPYDVILPLPDRVQPALYAILLTVFDTAGRDFNFAFARRFILYDNSSLLETRNDEILRVDSASVGPTGTRQTWQTDVSKQLCVNWTRLFYNKAMIQNPLLKPVKQNATAFPGEYDQISGVLPVNGTDNAEGVIKFETSWKRNAEAQTPFQQTADLHNQTLCLPEPLHDGETFEFWVRASDIMNNTKVANVTVHIDHTGPEVLVEGIRGARGIRGLHVLGTKDLQTLVLDIRASDPHSGLHDLMVAVGTAYLTEDVGKAAFVIQHLSNQTNCSLSEPDCYCPTIGTCENQTYVIEFGKIILVNNSVGNHHRQYFVTINATNNAFLRTTQIMDIIVDASPPIAGVVMEGWSDDVKAETDFTNNPALPVRWSGFSDLESGVSLYRVALLEKCPTLKELEDHPNATEVEGSKPMSGVLTVPREGRYFTAVVAYNGALQPSQVGCSDGVVYDTTPPALVNVSLRNSRTGRAIACTHNNQSWLIHENGTRVRLAPVSECHTACARSALSVDVDHLPLTTGVTLDWGLSRDLCGRLPIMEEDHRFWLPSDNIRLSWECEDAESATEEFFVGIGRDRSSSASPDLRPLTPTNGHHSYHERHLGVSNGVPFFIFLRAVNKAGLDVIRTFGPVVVDVTPPDVTEPLVATVQNGYLTVTWNRSTFYDPEQPTDLPFDVSFRIGHEQAYLTPFMSRSAQFPCQGTNVTGCVQYPVSSLERHDTEQGRVFFVSLHVTNAAGHVTSVNSSGVRLPAHSLPAHVLVMDVVKFMTGPGARTTPGASSAGPETTDTSPPATSGYGLYAATGRVVSSHVTENPDLDITAQDSVHGGGFEFSEDVDVILQIEEQEICTAWSRFSHDEDIDIKVGIGTSAGLNDVKTLVSPDNGTDAFCYKISTFPSYVKLYSVVQVTSYGQSRTFSSDGMIVVPYDDSRNEISVYNGKGCTIQDRIGFFEINPLENEVNLRNVTDVPLEPGDLLFVKFSPLQTDVFFDGALSLQTLLSGYQIVVETANVSIRFARRVPGNTTLEIFNCLMDTHLISKTMSGFDAAIETTGPWTGLMRSMRVEVVDETCLQTANKRNKYKYLQCRAASAELILNNNKTTMNANPISGHQYKTVVRPCLDNGCLPPHNSSTFLYETVTRTVSIAKAGVTSQAGQKIEVSLYIGIEPSIPVIQGLNVSCIVTWVLAKDEYGSLVVSDWRLFTIFNCSNMLVNDVVDVYGESNGGLFACLRLIYPVRTERLSCSLLARPRHTSSTRNQFHLVEVSRNALHDNHFEDLLHSLHQGSKLHELFDLDIDFISCGTDLAAILSDGDNRTVTWYLMTGQRVPVDGDCPGDPLCQATLTSTSGTVVFPRSVIPCRDDGETFFVCALVGPRAEAAGGEGQGHGRGLTEVCGDGVTLANTSPLPGTVTILNAPSGYLGTQGHVSVAWGGFTHAASNGLRQAVLNYSVSLGSYPGSEDIYHSVSVGQRTSWTFDIPDISTVVNCYATVKAEDRTGHLVQAFSSNIIVDTTPPAVGQVTAGPVPQETYISGSDLGVYWDKIEDHESGILITEVSVISEEGQTVVPFLPCSGQSASINISSLLSDGHGYILVLKATNRAGLSSITVSAPFVADSSPPSKGIVKNVVQSGETPLAYVSRADHFAVQWSGFEDPHSGVAYFRVGLGSSVGLDDVHPFINVGLQTAYEWKMELVEGIQYYTSVEACNQASLCSIASSGSMIFDSTPPLPGRVTVGRDERHSNFLSHIDILPVQWIGFSDPQTGIADFRWCAGLSPSSCDVIPTTHAMLSHGTTASGLSLPPATPLYVTVISRNKAGLETVGISHSFKVDVTPPTVTKTPQFLSSRDGHTITSQWDRSVLRLAWEFNDADSNVVSHSVSIRSRLTGRSVIDPIELATDNEVIVTLKEGDLLIDGDRHWAVVTACNAAGLCTTANSSLLLIDSSPPYTGTFLSPIPFDRVGGNEVFHLAWTGFSDAESDVVAYDVMLSRDYNGDELSNGAVRVNHSGAAGNQSRDLSLQCDIVDGEILYLSIRAENSVGLASSTIRMAYRVFIRGNSTGTLELIRHSCPVAYCTGECSCAAAGERCPGTFQPCVQDVSDSAADKTYPAVSVHIGPSPSQKFSTSVKCLEGHWTLTDPSQVANVSRFEFSFGLQNKTEGYGVFADDENSWHDVGRGTHVIHCLPDGRRLSYGSNYSYVLYLRVWISFSRAKTIVSSPIVIDPTPPKLTKRRTVMESDARCVQDVDYMSAEPNYTACWDRLFQDADSPLVRYEVWAGSSEFGSDLLPQRDVGLNTSITISTRQMEEGKRYYVTVRAWNAAGLSTTAVSDGIVLDLTPPVSGVVFPTSRYGSRHAQSSSSTLPASWYGFEVKHSSVKSYQVALYHIDNGTDHLLDDFVGTGFATGYTFSGLSLQHGHRYRVAVKATDMAGLESSAAFSTPLLIDTTPPVGLACRTFRKIDQLTLRPFSRSSSFSRQVFVGQFLAGAVGPNELLKIEVLATGSTSKSGGYVETGDARMPLSLHATNNAAVKVAQHVFTSAPAAQKNGTADVRVMMDGDVGASFSASLYQCVDSAPSSEQAVTIQQLSPNTISVCARVVDPESGIRVLKIGVGTTVGGLQIKPFTSLGHAGHHEFRVDVQPATVLYAVVVAENNAGARTRFVSNRLVMDATPPTVSEIKVSLLYEDVGHRNSTLKVEVEAEWTAADAESGVEICLCELKGQTANNSSVQQIADASPGRCQWELLNPRHEASVHVVVTCRNRLGLQTVVASQDHTVILKRPAVEQLTIRPLANNRLTSPFELSDPYFQSAESDILFYWRGLDDRRISGVHYRYVYGSQVTDWRSTHPLKTSALLQAGVMGKNVTGDVTLQLQVQNQRHMMSDIVSKTVKTGNPLPSLSGAAASVKLENSGLHLDWYEVFNTGQNLSFAIFAGTSDGYGDVINHVITTETSLTVPYSKSLADVYVLIEAVHRNGAAALYKTHLLL